MQTNSYNLLLDAEQAYLPQDTDTRTPQTLVPIYYIHDIRTPFCTRPHCFCQQGRQAVTTLYREIVKGDVLLAQLTQVLESSQKSMSATTSATHPTVHRVHVSLVDGIPEMCQLFGHSWERTVHPGVKQCSLCGVNGYCPGCTPLPPQNAQPFTCSAHLIQRQVQQ